MGAEHCYFLSLKFLHERPSNLAILPFCRFTTLFFYTKKCPEPLLHSFLQTYVNQGFVALSRIYILVLGAVRGHSMTKAPEPSYNFLLKSSMSILACARILFKVPFAISLCIGTITTRLPSDNFKWLPRCEISEKPNSRKTPIASLDVHTGYLDGIT